MGKKTERGEDYCVYYGDETFTIKYKFNNHEVFLSADTRTEDGHLALLGEGRFSMYIED